MSLGYEKRDVRLPRFGRSLADAVTSADGNEHGALVLLRLFCLIPFRGVRFTNGFTCGGHAHGSGGGRPHLSNLCILPAWTRSLIFPAADIILCILRIMDTFGVTARPAGTVALEAGGATNTLSSHPWN